MNGLEPPPDGDRDRGPILIAVYWTALALASFIVSLRLYARHRIRAIGPDDLAMLLSVVGRTHSRACGWRRMLTK